MKYVLCFCLIYFFSCSQKTPETRQMESAPAKATPNAVVNSVEDTASAAAQTQYTIRISKAGLVEKGMHAGILYEMYDSTLIRKSVQKTGSQPRGYTYSVFEKGTSKPLMTCTTTSSDTITGIEIQGIDFRTEKGIGVGSSFADLTSAYHVSEIYMDKNSRVLVKVEELQQKENESGGSTHAFIEFEIGYSAEGVANEKGEIAPSAIPPNVEIISILL